MFVSGVNNTGEKKKKKKISYKGLCNCIHTSSGKVSIPVTQREERLREREGRHPFVHLFLCELKDGRSVGPIKTKEKFVVFHYFCSIAQYSVNTTMDIFNAFPIHFLSNPPDSVIIK
jgi:hypothetical protein